MAEVTLEKISKKFGDKVVLPSVDLSIKSGEFIVLVGPSGCGKSTLLRMVAGLESITTGNIRIAGRVVNDVEPKNRGIAMVFQNYALYPHMSVAENMAFALRISGVEKSVREEKVKAAAKILGIEEHLHKKPSQLSGGQKQRVAIGRAMVREPQVFLFDEPLSNLDAQLRVRMRSEISHLHKRLGCTIIYVTHDQVEAMTLADRIVVLKDGNVEQVGTPLEVYREPKTRFVASFIGTPSMNFLSTEKLPSSLSSKGKFVGFRPEFTATRANGKSVEIAKGRVSLVEILGKEALVHIQVGKDNVISAADAGNTPALDEEVSINVHPDNFFYFNEAGARL